MISQLQYVNKAKELRKGGIYRQLDVSDVGLIRETIIVINGVDLRRGRGWRLKLSCMLMCSHLGSLQHAVQI